MTNAKETYEAKILETLIKNSERLAVVETKLTFVETGVETLQQQVDRLDSRLGLVETKLTGLDTRVETLQQQVDNLDSRLGLVETKLTGLDTTVKQVNSKLNWLFGAVFAVGAGILATLYSEPILSALGK
ncbi:MAG: hypothetical protein AB4038_11520 [Prochloraceae cyanobacterium]